MNLWKIPGIPHKGWICIDVIDLGPLKDGAERFTCEMCGTEDIRYVHVLSHPKSIRNYSVGCVCAEHMTDDYVNPRRRENALKKNANKLQKWLDRTWKISKKGNQYLNISGINLGIYKCGSKWGMWIDDYRYKELYDTETSAKIALFHEYAEYSFRVENYVLDETFFAGK